MQFRTLGALAALAAGAGLAPAALAQSAQQKNAAPTILDTVKGAVQTVAGSPLATADPDMRHVLDALDVLSPKPFARLKPTQLAPQPLPSLTPTQARQQPTLGDAAMQVLREQGKSTLPDPTVSTKNILVDGADGKIVATVYKPANASGALPAIVYFHGGGFVVANNATYATSCDILAKKADAVVVEVEYRKAPEHKFPAAHQDAVAAYKWVTQNAGSLGADPRKIALAGEGAGGNLAIDTAIAARNQKLAMPAYELIVSPMAGTNFGDRSYRETDSPNLQSLNASTAQWDYRQLISSPDDMLDPRLDIVGKADLHGLAPATVITAQIDPLHDEGVVLANKLKAVGVAVDARDYSGVTHGFFSMGEVVGKARQAEDVAAADLKKAFASKSASR